MESKDISDASSEPSPAASRGGVDAASSSPGDGGGGDCPKCRVCKKRLGRRSCPRQACVKCCDDPDCEPHREARDLLQKKQSILDGTDWITRTAARKRASKVVPGMFFDSDIRYFGETVVIWNGAEFMENRKWREDAMRRSRNKRDHVELSNERGGRKRRKERVEEGAAARAGGGRIPVVEEKTKKTKPMSRKRRFDSICDELYQKSLGGK